MKKALSPISAQKIKFSVAATTAVSVPQIKPSTPPLGKPMLDPPGVASRVRCIYNPKPKTPSTSMRTSSVPNASAKRSQR